MQYTSNYNLLLPEGTDTVNLLTQMNPNTSDIDAAMFANKQAVVGRATELTAGTVHAITRSNQDSPVFAFTATSNWTAGDTLSVDGVAVSVYLPDGTTPATGAYVINSEVLAIIQGSRVTLFTPSASATASDVSYDNTASGLTATDVQDAIDETVSKILPEWTYVDELTYIGSSSSTAQTKAVVIPNNTKELMIQIVTSAGAVLESTIFKPTDASGHAMLLRYAGGAITDYVTASLTIATSILSISWLTGTALSNSTVRLYAK